MLGKAEIHMSTKVTKIVSNTKLESDHSLSIAVSTDTNDTPLLYDEVVVTVPLGFLKRNLSSFSPPLPDHLVNAISHISYGRLEKLYVNFPHAYWVDGQSTAACNSFWMHFLQPTYARKQNPQGWGLECVSLAAFPNGCAQPTLLFYMHGACAEHVTSLINNLSPESPEYYTRLNDFFSPYYSLLPSFDRSSPDCIPKGFLATNWQNDEFAGYGSYTNFQVSHSAEQVQYDKDIEALRHGAPERHVWLAGEHTAPFVALGTVTGAYWSGEAVAKRVLHAYGMLDAEDEVQDLGHGGDEMMDGQGEGTAHGAGLVAL